MSVISLPDTRQPIDDIISSLWDDFLVDVDSLEDLVRIRRKPTVASKLEALSDDDVYKAIRRKHEGVEEEDRPVKEVEFEALSEVKEELGSDVPDGNFFARALPKKDWTASWMESIERVFLVHRLREVVAQVGFTRFESVGVDIQGELTLDVKRAPLALDLKWLPAIENRGEGIFLLLKSEAVNHWAQNSQVTKRGIQLLEGFRIWKDEKKSSREFPGLPFYFLHSLSHLLLTVIS
jgi:hypothetical protein